MTDSMAESEAALDPLSGYQERVVLAARVGPNASVLSDVLASHAHVQMVEPSLEAVSEAIRTEAALVVLTEEVLIDPELAVQLGDRLNQQPDWSDIPVIILLSECQRFSDCLALLGQTTYQRSVLLLELPLQRPIFASVVGTCLTNRRRQYKLRNTLHQLKTSNQALEGFSYTAAHELRNPLGVMTTSFDLLARASLAPKQQEIVAMGQRTSKRMNKMLTALLDYSKVQADEDEFVVVDMESVFNEAIASLQVLIQESGVELNWETPLPEVRGKHSLLIQLVSNLIKNAIVHNDAPSPTVTFAAQLPSAAQSLPSETPPDRPYLPMARIDRTSRCLFTISDNGPGIDPQAQAQIFDMFNRAGKSKQDGSGIGLALCRRVVAQHHGKIGVRSTLGEGSTFYFDLPSL